LPVINWLMNRIALIVAGTPLGGYNDLIATHRFLETIELDFAGIPGVATRMDARFPVDTGWLSQVVTLDASLGMYDYIRGRVRMAPGERHYTMNGVDIHNGKPIEFMPDRAEMGAGLLPGEIDIDLMLVNGLTMAPKEAIPPLDQLIDPADMEWKLPPHHPAPAP